MDGMDKTNDCTHLCYCAYITRYPPISANAGETGQKKNPAISDGVCFQYTTGNSRPLNFWASIPKSGYPARHVILITSGMYAASITLAPCMVSVSPFARSTANRGITGLFAASLSIRRLSVPLIATILTCAFFQLGQSFHNVRCFRIPQGKFQHGTRCGHSCRRRGLWVSRNR